MTTPVRAQMQHGQHGRRAPRAPPPIAQTAPQPEQSGLADLPYQTLFDAIAAATDAGDAPISISVKAFRAALSAKGQSNSCPALTDVAAERRPDDRLTREPFSLQPGSPGITQEEGT
ncbi:MAG: hypothetical protein GY701_12530 [Sulfitobacter sp.]|nr:hypothetical protein [Sulfitobacter sp.]